MDDLATEFGISKKTLYQFFFDKENLVDQVFDYYMNHPVFNLDKTEYGNAIDRIFALRSHVADVLKNFNNNLDFELRKLYPDLYKKWHDFKVRKIFNDALKNLEDGKKQGLFRKDLDSEFIAKLQVGRMLYTLNPETGIFVEQEVVSLEMFDKVMEYHMHAICTPKGLKYYNRQLEPKSGEKVNEQTRDQ